jgi:hypothetical protein
MSFGFEENDLTLEEAIDKTNILMFAASTNFGATEDHPVRFPARAKHKVICIHAADGIGKPYGGNPPDSSKDENFSTLGVCVPLGKKIDPKSQQSQTVYRSGTSVATPIAAGIAALVLEFAWQDGTHKKVENREKLQTCIGMSSVLRRMAKAGKKDGFSFIWPPKVLLAGPNHAESNESKQMGEVCANISEALKDRYSWY